MAARRSWIGSKDITAGTLDHEGQNLEHQGLSGDCRRTVQLGAQGNAEVTFTRLLFQQTSFNVGNRPFHFVVTVFGVQGQPIAATTHGDEAPATEGGSKLSPLVCLYSSPVRVDARKRSKGERPEASADDVRLASRQRPDPKVSAAVSKDGAPAHGAGPNAVAAGANGYGALSNAPMDSVDGSRFSAMQIFDASLDALLELRPDGVIVKIMTSTAFGYSAADLLGRSLYTICYRDDCHPLLQTFEALLATANSERAAAHIAGQTAPTRPRSLRVLHRVIVGLGGSQGAHLIPVDSIISVHADLSPQTFVLSSRRALPASADATANSQLQVFPWDTAL